MSGIKTDREKIIDEIRDIRILQDNKWGMIETREMSLDRWMVVLMEEVGEAATEVVEGDRLKLYQELIDVVGVAVSILERLRYEERMQEEANE